MDKKSKNKIMAGLAGESNTDVMTLEEAWRYLRISEPTLRKLTLNGDIPGKKCGAQWRFSRKALENCMNSPKAE